MGRAPASPPVRGRPNSGAEPSCSLSRTVVRRAVLDRLGYSADNHRRWFRRTKLGPTDRPFVYAHKLKDAATRWLQPVNSNGEQRMLGQIVLEQFMEGLPTDTAEWVGQHLSAVPHQRPEGGCQQLTLHITQQRDHLLSPVLTFPVLSFHPRFQLLQVLLPNRRGSLRWQGRSVGGEGSLVIFATSARLWRSDK